MKTILSFNRLLGICFAFICMLIFCRIIYSHSIQHLFLTWNIFLAWIPYMLSRYFMQYEKKKIWKQCFLFLTWLVFFPNALYILTDLVHLQDEHSAPAWFDAILLFTSSFIGLIMAFASLHNAEQYLQKKWKQTFVSVIIPAIIFLGSFGVYLGRFERWNSWDIIRNPLSLGTDIIECFIFPREHIRSWGVTFILTALFYIIYAFSKVLPQGLQKKKSV